MAYADYTFYTADFHGNKISETDYPYFAGWEERCVGKESCEACKSRWFAKD